MTGDAVANFAARGRLTIECAFRLSKVLRQNQSLARKGRHWKATMFKNACHPLRHVRPCQQCQCRAVSMYRTRRSNRLLSDIVRHQWPLKLEWRRERYTCLAQRPGLQCLALANEREISKPAFFGSITAYLRADAFSEQCRLHRRLIGVSRKSPMSISEHTVGDDWPFCGRCPSAVRRQHLRHRMWHCWHSIFTLRRRPADRSATTGNNRGRRDIRRRPAKWGPETGGGFTIADYFARSLKALLAAAWCRRNLMRTLRSDRNRRRRWNTISSMLPYFG